MLGDVRDPEPVGAVGHELAVDQIVRGDGVTVSSSAASTPASGDAFEPVEAHQTLDAFAAHSDALPESQLGVDPR